MAAAHVAAVGLQQEGPLVAPGSQAGAVVEDAAVAAVGGVPRHVAALRVAVLLVVRGHVAVAVHRDAVDDLVAQGQHALLHLRKQAIGQVDGQRKRIIVACAMNTAGGTP